MRCICSPFHDAWLNIAAEEYALKNLSGDCFILYRNQKSIIVGTHQNTLAEINHSYVRDHDIKVVRRLSGGGAVFHDLGNLNFTFIRSTQPGESMDFRKFTEPILEVLHKLGVEARFEGRNDLTINGMKFSGNAEHVHRNRILHHGTLLFSSLISDLSEALAPNPLKFTDKAVKSVRSRVTNISDHLPIPMSIDAFQEKLLKHMEQRYPDSYHYEYTQEDIRGIQKLAEEKYSTWEWNFGSSPKYNFSKGLRTAGGNIECHLNVEKGLITGARIFGDFFSHRPTSELEQALNGQRHERAHLAQWLSQIEITEYFLGIRPEEFLDALF
jgi:lipoate-protein ligase A